MDTFLSSPSTVINSCTLWPCHHDSRELQSSIRREQLKPRNCQLASEILLVFDLGAAAEK